MARNYDLGFEKNTNNDYENFITYWGQVIAGPEDDPSGAGRCKVFIRLLDRHIFGDDGSQLKESDFLKEPENYGEIMDTVPWSYPLQPKFLVTQPKYGETVVVFVANKKKEFGDRFYSGPFISQPQFINRDGVLRGILTGKRGTSSGELPYKKAWFKNKKSRLGGELSSENWSVYGNHPKDPDDVTINGRGNEDIILKHSTKFDEVLLRVNKYSNQNVEVLNLQNPGYISLVSHRNRNKSETSVNIVAEKINLISHKGSSVKGKPKEGSGAIILNSSDPTKQINLENQFLHPTVYGDVLWDVLKLLRSWVENHIHEGDKLPPDQETNTTELLKKLDYALGEEPKEETSSDGITYKIYQGNLISNNIKIN